MKARQGNQEPFDDLRGGRQGRPKAHLGIKLLFEFLQFLIFGEQGGSGHVNTLDTSSSNGRVNVQLTRPLALNGTFDYFKTPASR
jgi:hypothetical protein